MLQLGLIIKGQNKELSKKERQKVSIAILTVC